jgi:hypothetical protein
MDLQNMPENQPVRVGSPLGTTTSTDQTPMDIEKGVGRRTSSMPGFRLPIRTSPTNVSRLKRQVSTWTRWWRISASLA